MPRPIPQEILIVTPKLDENLTFLSSKIFFKIDKKIEFAEVRAIYEVNSAKLDVYFTVW